MKPGQYNVFLVLNSNGPATCIQKATCECAAGSVISVFFFWSNEYFMNSTFHRKSASCTHVSAVLYALVAVTSNGQLQYTPNSTLLEMEDESMQVTSKLCKWKIPPKRKESNQSMSTAVFIQHDYQKSNKRRVSLTEDFDSRPVQFRGNAKSLLTDLLEQVHGESLGISLSFDPRYCNNLSVPTSSKPDIPCTSQLQYSVAEFKASLILAKEKLQKIEQDIRGQCHSPLRYSAHRYRISASHFGDILHRKSTTPPDAQVLSIMQPCSFSSAATARGIQNEPIAIRAYLPHQHQQMKSSVTVQSTGFIISQTYPYLGANSDGSVYDPHDVSHPNGYLEIKCSYSHRNSTPLEAGYSSGFCSSNIQDTKNTPVLKLKKIHKYFAQVQGQLAVDERKWCDFVIFTNKGISIERIKFDEEYWKTILFPKLQTFFDNCLAPEIISPVHAIGLPIRKL